MLNQYDAETRQAALTAEGHELSDSRTQQRNKCSNAHCPGDMCKAAGPNKRPGLDTLT